jgi:hypothetical protein
LIDGTAAAGIRVAKGTTLAHSKPQCEQNRPSLLTTCRQRRHLTKDDTMNSLSATIQPHSAALTIIAP